MSRHELSGWTILSVMTVAAGIGTSGCRKTASDSDQAQIGQSVGEMMASADEPLQGGTTTAMLNLTPVLRVPFELRAPAWRRAVAELFPSAHAAACAGVAFSSCANGRRTLTFSSCDIGDAKLDGMVTLSFSNAAVCAMPATGDSVTRTGSFTLTGPYGGTLQVTAPGGGQTLTRTAGGFTYHVGGMERVLTGPGGQSLFDVATDTTSDIVITGSSRSDRVIVSGALEIHHKLAGYTVALTPSNLAWTPSCNCASSGTLTGTVSGGPNDGKSALVTITGCGEATVTLGSTTEPVTLDRCAAI